MDKTLVASAGEHFIAYKLSCLGYLAALVRQGSPSIDLLASTQDGDVSVGIQVKTTAGAGRTRGRGANKILAELQFPLGHKAIERSPQNIIFCFVDLKVNESGIPDVYVIPSDALLAEHEGIDVRQWTFFRLHRSVEHMEKYKNCWQPIHQALGKSG
jgi:hypothetical protein